MLSDPDYSDHGNNTRDRSMSERNASKRKSQGSHTGSRGEKHKRTTMTTAAQSDGESDGAETVPPSLAQSLATLRSRCDQERLQNQRSMDELRGELEASQQQAEKYREKYNSGLNDLVEQKQSSKVEINRIRAEMVATAAELVKAAHAQAGIDIGSETPQGSRKSIQTQLDKLRTQDQKVCADLIKTQPEYIRLAAQIKVEKAVVEKQKQKVKDGEEDEGDDDPPTPEEAMKILEEDFIFAINDMRTNSTLANQKNTMTKKTVAILAEFKEVFFHLIEEKSAPTPTKPQMTDAEVALVHRKNQQLQAMVNDYGQKLKSLREKLEDEVQLRKKAEGEEVNDDEGN